MKILILTQKVNKDDPILGFFHRWIEEFAKHFEKVTVICLEKGKSELPEEIRTFSLGKERKVSRFSYIRNFFSIIWRERKNYDVVFVHMNQEYVLLGALLWKMMGKRVYLWRNHQQGNFLTSLACFFCDTTFCTSAFSFINRYKKNVLMPVGVDLEDFYPRAITRVPHSILFTGRIAPVKNQHLLIDALSLIHDLPWTLTIIGPNAPKDFQYKESLKSLVRKNKREDRVVFKEGVPHEELPLIYSAHDLSVNLSPSGMFDKTIFEGMACGAITLTTNQNLIGEIRNICVPKENDSAALLKSLRTLLSDEIKKDVLRNEQMEYTKEKHSLEKLVKKLVSGMC